MAFTEQQIQKVWEKANIDPNNNPNDFRKDACNAWIQRSQYGNRDSIYGWEIDHIKPKSDNGTDEISNLRPLHWENNLAKSDGRLVCVVVSQGITNKRR